MTEASRRDESDSEVLAGAVLATMAGAELTLATAESLTGGRLARILTGIAGASEVFLGGVVAYATEVKVAVLEVPQGIVDGPGVVSAECAEAMATGVRRITGAAYGVSTTGVAGPALQEGKPVGTVFIAVAGPDGVSSWECDLAGDRATIRRDACTVALERLLSAVG